jgi:hypothetical protein
LNYADYQCFTIESNKQRSQKNGVRKMD